MSVARVSQVCGIALLFLGTAVSAQWRGLGPEGGDMIRVLADPAVPGRVYALGSFGMSRSDDAGRNWMPVGSGLFANRVGEPWGLAADSQVPGRLYMLAAFGRVLRSDDSALSWTPTGYVLPPFMQVLDFFPARYTLTAVSGVAGSLLLVLPNGDNYKSTDSGATFQPWTLPVPAGRAVSSIAFDPADAQHVLATLVRAEPGGQPGAPLLRSSDGGVTWTVVSGVPAVADAGTLGFHGQQRVTALLNGQLHISTDNGQTWQLPASLSFGGIVVAAPVGPLRLTLSNGRQCVSSANKFIDLQPCADGWPSAVWPHEETRLQDLVAVRDGEQDYRLIAAANVHGVLAYSPDTSRWESVRGVLARPMRGLALQPGDSRRLFTGSWLSTGYADSQRVFVSADAGQSWNGRLDGLAASIRSIAIDPTTAADPGSTVIYAAGTTLRILDVPYNSGVYRSSDGGVAWTALNDGFPPHTGSSGGVQSSTVRKVMLDPRSCAAPPAQGPCAQGPLNTVYLVTVGPDRRIYKSTQGGAAWQRSDTGLPDAIEDAQGYENVQFVDLEIDPLNGDLYVAGVVDSFNNDGSTRVPGIFSGVFHSSDGGASWQHRSSGLPRVTGSATTSQDVMALAVHPRQAGTLWASAAPPSGSARIYRSSDGGASWSPAGAALDGCAVLDLQVDTAAPDVIYAAGQGVGGGEGCVFRSENGGASWTALHAGLPLGAVYDLRQDPDDRRRLVIATQRGVWEGRLPGDRIFTDIGQ